jgi:signal transduction histidine kinase
MTGLAARLAPPPSWLHLPRPTARLRLTLLYGCLFTLSGAALLGFTYWLFDRATAGKRILPILGPGSDITCLPKHHGCRGAFQIYIRQHALDLHTLLAQSGIALAVMAALAFALGWLIAGRVLRPVRAITATARRVSATSLHQRLALAGPDDEFKELAATLNDLLGRLEASFTAQRHFVANASHELRTPLTLDRTLLQVALRNPRTTIEQWRACAQELLESSQHQERLLEALLALATSEGAVTNRQPADLSEAAAASLRAAGPQIGEQELRVETSLGPAPVLGDPDLIRRLADNLVDNAVHYNRIGGAVRVATGWQKGHATLSIANTGPVIPPAEIARLFRPFERLATTRRSNGNGHGLGLSIVAAIASAHSADVVTHARPDGGLLIEVSFPAGHAASHRLSVNDGAAVAGAAGGVRLPDQTRTSAMTRRPSGRCHWRRHRA